MNSWFINKNDTKRFNDLLNYLEAKKIEFSETAFDSFNIIVIETDTDTIIDIRNKGLIKPYYSKFTSIENEIQYYKDVICSNSQWDKIPINDEIVDNLLTSENNRYFSVACELLSELRDANEWDRDDCEYYIKQNFNAQDIDEVMEALGYLEESEIETLNSQNK